MPAPASTTSDQTLADHNTTAPAEKGVYTDAEAGVVNDEKHDALPAPRKGDTLPAPGRTISEAARPPDGGLKAWMTVAGAWLVLFSTFGYVNAFGTYENYYLAHNLSSYTASDIAWIGSLQLFLQFSSGAVTGPLFDKGYFWSITIFGSVLYVFGLMMLSLATEYYQIILAQGICAGLGIGILFLPCLSVLAHHFSRRRALATGIVVSGSSCGGVVFPIMLNNMFNGSVGFPWAVRASAFLIMGCLIVAHLLMSHRFKEIGLVEKPKPDIKGIFKDVIFQLSTAGLFFIMLGIFFGFFYIQVYSESSGLSQTLSRYTLTILNGASIFGRVLPNFAADYIGCFNMLIACSTITGIMILFFPLMNNIAGVILFCLIYGFFSGSYISLMSPSLMTTARHPSEIGARIGLPMLFLAVAGLVGTPIDGALLGKGNPLDYPWYKASTFSGVVILFGSAILFAGRFLHARRKGTQKV